MVFLKRSEQVSEWRVHDPAAACSVCSVGNVLSTVEMTGWCIAKHA